MGEALLIKTGKSGENGSGRTGLITEIFTSNTLWKVPEGIRNNEVSVRIFGGGGGGNGIDGGGGGYMNNGIVNVSNDSEIYITIGLGGSQVYTGSGLNSYLFGGTTSFGTYLSALGAGIHGGSGGGGRIANGYQFGGGGGVFFQKYFASSSNGKQFIYDGGHGGKWGGGGGGTNLGINISRGGCLYENSQNMYEVTGYSGLGGNGGCGCIGTKVFLQAENGTNTIGMGLEFEGAGLAGELQSRDNNHFSVYYAMSGGGGYGGNGGSFGGITGYNSGCGGGGGYGANGGNGAEEYLRSSTSQDVGGGGGGGYGGDGGDAYRSNSGGGGGYGKHGKGGGWDNSTNSIRPAGIAAGGCGNMPGGSGICILQYYID